MSSEDICRWLARIFPGSVHQEVVPRNQELTILMPIVEYTPDRFHDVKTMALKFHAQINLADRAFVDYYYATRGWCRLYLYFSDRVNYSALWARTSSFCSQLLRIDHSRWYQLVFSPARGGW